MNIYLLLDRLSPVIGSPAAWITILAALLAINIRDFRLSVPLLGVQYLFAGLLFIDVLEPRLAVAFVIAGLFVTLILLVTGWQIGWEESLAVQAGHSLRGGMLDSSLRIGPLTLSRHVGLCLLLSVAGIGLAFALSRTGGGILAVSSPVQPHLSLAIYGLGFLGLIGLLTATGPFSAGIGLLLFINGFSLFYSTLGPPSAMLVALISLQLMVAVVVSYLAQARRLSVIRS